MDGLKVTRHPFLPGALSRKKSGESDYFLRLVTKILGDFIAPVQKNHFPFYFPVQKIPWFFNPQLYFYPAQNKMDVCERINVENNDDKAQKLLLYKINKFNKTPPLTKSWKMFEKLWNLAVLYISIQILFWHSKIFATAHNLMTSAVFYKQHMKNSEIMTYFEIAVALDVK